jgi:hypothetical protein
MYFPSLDEIINNRLFLLYGREQLTGLPKYRLVRSEKQTEKRYGSYDVMTQETGIWLGVKQGLVEIKKYWYFNDCWVLERVEPNLNRQDIFYEKFTYEPIFPFIDKNNNILPLEWKAIEFIVNAIEKKEKPKILSETEHHDNMEADMAKESERDFGIIDAPEAKPLPTFNTSTLIPKRMAK